MLGTAGNDRAGYDGHFVPVATVRPLGTPRRHWLWHLVRKPSDVRLSCYNSCYNTMFCILLLRCCNTWQGKCFDCRPRPCCLVRYATRGQEALWENQKLREWLLEQREHFLRIMHER